MYNNKNNGQFLEKLTGDFISELFPGAYMTVDTEDDKYNGTDGIIPWPNSKTGHIRFDITFNLEEKDHYIFLGSKEFIEKNSPLKVRFAYRFGNSHKGETLFREPVLVIDITDCNQNKFENQLAKRDPDAISEYKNQFKKIFTEGAVRFTEYTLIKENFLNISEVDKEHSEIILEAISKADKKRAFIIAEKLYSYKVNESKSKKINHQVEEKLVEKNGNCIGFVKNQNTKLQIAAVKESPEAIQFIKYPTRETVVHYKQSVLAHKLPNADSLLRDADNIKVFPEGTAEKEYHKSIFSELQNIPKIGSRDTRDTRFNSHESLR